MGEAENKQSDAENIEINGAGASASNDAEAESVDKKQAFADQESEQPDADGDLQQDDVVSDAESADQSENDGASDPVAELEAAQTEIAKLKDAFLRAKAEEDNVRRRAEKEVANSRKFAIEGFAKEMMNVYDSLKLACSVEVAEDADAAVKSIHEGVEITLKQLNSAFAKFSLVEIAPEPGDKLDPNLHQAMSMIESEDIEPGCIINVIQSGFSLHDRLLRPAMVVVAKT